MFFSCGRQVPRVRLILALLVLYDQLQNCRQHPQNRPAFEVVPGLCLSQSMLIKMTDNYGQASRAVLPSIYIYTKAAVAMFTDLLCTDAKNTVRALSLVLVAVLYLSSKWIPRFTALISFLIVSLKGNFLERSIVIRSTSRWSTACVTNACLCCNCCHLWCKRHKRKVC